MSTTQVDARQLRRPTAKRMDLKNILNKIWPVEVGLLCVLKLCAAA